MWTGLCRGLAFRGGVIGDSDGEAVEAVAAVMRGEGMLLSTGGNSMT